VRHRAENSSAPRMKTQTEAMAVDGVGMDAPTETLPSGGRQSASPYRCDLLPAQSLLAAAGVLKVGADKYGVENWKLIPLRDHVNHALTHLLAFIAGDAQDRHLVNALCRVLFACELDLEQRRKEGVD
jgi:hypothetical protein